MITLFTIHFTNQATVVVLGMCATLWYLAWAHHQRMKKGNGGT